MSIYEKGWSRIQRITPRCRRFHCCVELRGFIQTRPQSYKTSGFELGRGLSALPARGVCIDQAWFGQGRYGGYSQRQYAEMFEAHFAVPMMGGVLNAINMRLDAKTVAFILERGAQSYCWWTKNLDRWLKLRLQCWFTPQLCI